MAGRSFVSFGEQGFRVEMGKIELLSQTEAAGSAERWMAEKRDRRLD